MPMYLYESFDACFILSLKHREGIKKFGERSLKWICKFIAINNQLSGLLTSVSWHQSASYGWY